MHKSNKQSPPNKQQKGAALIMLLFVFILLLTAYILQKISPANINLERSQKTQQALLEAKSTLLGRAILDDNRPGSLPCPDAVTPINGSADLFYGNRCPSYIGRFPWRTLGIPALQDANGETLWYTLSSNYRDYPLATPLNSNTPGLLSMDAQNDVVAIIFSAGAPLNHQQGRPSNNNADYLEGENANGDLIFSALNNTTHNDRLIVITRNELMRQVERRVLGETTGSLLEYFSNPSHAYFPYSAATNSACETDLLTTGFIPTPTSCPTANLPSLAAWFSNNQWDNMLRYEVATACTKNSPNCSGSGLISDGDFADVRVRLTIAGSGQKRLIR